MMISEELFHFEKRRRCKMNKHLNSQAKGPKLDSALERFLYHRRGNFLIYLLLHSLTQLIFLLIATLGKISQVPRQSLLKKGKTLSFFVYWLI